MFLEHNNISLFARKPLGGAVKEGGLLYLNTNPIEWYNSFKVLRRIIAKTRGLQLNPIQQERPVNV